MAVELASKGLETYLPAVTEVHQWKDRRKVIDVPIFPGYVFTRLLDTPALRMTVLRTTGTVSILGCGGSIEPVPETEIAAIQRLLQVNAPLLTHPLLREGSWVRIRRGPLKDLEGLLVRIKNQARLVLSVELLSRSVSTEVDIRDVEVIRAAALPLPVAG
ncbi:MAG: hypothetical protein IT165_26655 [Bryobacterales bacterium]|nr:hypothetical protein [Bryobacterales bacterium]